MRKMGKSGIGKLQLVAVSIIIAAFIVGGALYLALT